MQCEYNGRYGGSCPGISQIIAWVSSNDKRLASVISIKVVALDLQRIRDRCNRHRHDQAE